LEPSFNEETISNYKVSLNKDDHQ